MKANLNNILPVSALIAVSTALTATPSIGVPLKLHTAADGTAFIWQAFTCHFVHCTTEHLFYDALCLFILGFLLSRRELILTLLLAAPFVSAAVLLTRPELTTYCGLSGVNCALYAVFAIKLFRRQKGLGTAALGAIILKTILEISADRTFFATSGFIPVHEAHLAGIAVGVAIAAFMTMRQLTLENPIKQEMHGWL